MASGPPAQNWLRLSRKTSLPRGPAQRLPPESKYASLFLSFLSQAQALNSIHRSARLPTSEKRWMGSGRALPGPNPSIFFLRWGAWLTCLTEPSPVDAPRLQAGEETGVPFGEGQWGHNACAT